MWQAAEARAQQQSLMPTGPRKLGSAGGSSINHKHLTPAQAAAAAAERRARDNVWCGAEHSADEVEQEVGLQADNAPSTGTTQTAAAAPGAAARTGSSGPFPTGAAQQQQQQTAAAAGPSSSRQQQQQQQQQADDINVANSHQPQLTQQQLVLQQQWQQHLQQQHTQLQQQRQRKRPAVDTVDLTVSDSEDEGQLPEAAAAAGAEVQQQQVAGGNSSGRFVPAVPTVPATCPCCAAGLQRPLDAAVMQRLERRQGYQQWCAVHRQQQRAAANEVGKWTCSVCTLKNPAAVLCCEACLTVKNVI